MKSAIHAVIGRSRTVLVAYIVIILAGILSYISLPKQAEPDISFPLVFVQLFLEGASPEDTERLLIRPMEQELRSIDGLIKMVATANESSASINLEFESDTDISMTLQDVRERVDLAKAELPPEAEEPRVQEAKMTRFDPMLVLNIGGEVPQRTLYNIARSTKEAIESVDGVLEANLIGFREELLEIVIDPLAMDSYGLAPNDVLGFVDRNNRLVAAGSMQSEQGRFAIKVPGVIESPEDVLNIPVKVDQGRVVHFRDIATVRRTYKDAESISRLNGQPAVTLEIVERSGSNMLSTVAEVKSVLNDLSQTWPENVVATFSRDKSIGVRNSLSTLVNNVTAAIVLVFIVLLAILGFQNALLVGLAIPGSFCATFFLLSLTGFPINTVVLFALIMSVGMLVDGAIVVSELADRKMAEGESRVKAYSEAAQRMATPIIASTLTTLVAFLPMIFWPGQLGSFMVYMPITLIFTLTASLVMALLVVPTLGTLIGRPGHFNERQRLDLAAAEDGDLNSIGGPTGQYIGVLSKVLDRPGLAVLAISALLVGIYMTYGAFGKGAQMWPPIEPSTGSVKIRARGDLSTQEKDQLVRQVEQRIFGISGIENIYVRSGTTNAGAASDQIGSVSLNFADWRTRRPAKQIVGEIRERTADIGGIEIEVATAGHAGEAQKPIDLLITAPTLDGTRDTVAQLVGIMQKMPELVNIEDSRPLPGIEWRLEVDRAQAAKFGADVSLVGSFIQLVTNGIKLGDYRPDDADDEIDIRVRFPSDQRSLDSLGELRVPSQQGSIPISTFVKRIPAESTQSITRTDRRRTMSVKAELADGALLGPTLDAITERFTALNPGPEIKLEARGSAEEQRMSLDFLLKGFGLALAMMGMILLTQFNSLFQSFLILTAVVFSTGGVFLGLLITNEPFGILSSGIGAIALAGIVVNNNIVLIDTYNKLREIGGDAKDIIIRTCAQRLRPVMLTTVTTVLGLMPMAMAFNINLISREAYFGGPSTAWWKSMAIVIAGGLVFATILTLVLTPAFLMIAAKVSERWANRRARKSSSADEGSTARI